MKKILNVFFCLALIVTNLAFVGYSASANDENYNFNGMDLLALKKFILGSGELTAKQRFFYDLSGKTLYDGMDLLLMKKIILGVDENLIEYPIAINEINFPDFQFRRDVMEFDLDGDGYLSEEEIALVLWIDVATDGIYTIPPGDPKPPIRYPIKTLKGIEYFFALETLGCSANYLTKLDLRKNTALKILGCNKNQIEYLYLKENTNLRLLRCMNNKFSELDISGNIAMEEMICDLDVAVIAPDNLILMENAFPFTFQVWERKPD